MTQILIVEGDDAFRTWIVTSLGGAGFECTATSRFEDARRAAESEDFDLALLALRLPDGDGLELLQRLIGTHPGLPVVVMTAYSSVPSAVEAMRRGAFDYLPKPFSVDQLVIVLRRALETRGLRREMDRLTQENLSRYGPEAIIGQGRAMRVLREQVRKVAESPAGTILIQGESGTGKDLVAKALHYASPRAGRPFVAINCSAIPDALLESELFGHERGAFTDARQAKRGLIEVAGGGTLFLDEVVELGPALQAKLLRFLEDRTIKRLGGTKDITVDVRIVAATNVNLAQAVRTGRFREDLFYRLRVVPLHVPALRERREDIPLLVHHFIDHFNRKFRKRFAGVAPDVFDLLAAHSWPGNVRELKNAIERVMLLEAGPEIRPEMLLLSESASAPAAAAPSGPAPAGGEEDLTMERLELNALVKALERAGGNQSRAARLLGISRDTVRFRMQRFGVTVKAQVIVEAPDPAPVRATGSGA